MKLRKTCKRITFQGNHLTIEKNDQIITKKNLAAIKQARIKIIRK